MTDQDKITQDDIVAAVTTKFYDDLEFIEKLNNLTYSRKVELKRNMKNK